MCAFHSGQSSVFLAKGFGEREFFALARQTDRGKCGRFAWQEKTSITPPIGGSASDIGTKIGLSAVRN
jgi:hypothetical protein